MTFIWLVVWLISHTPQVQMFGVWNNWANRARGLSRHRRDWQLGRECVAPAALLPRVRPNLGTRVWLATRRTQ
jgi:hypothetical protein